MVEGLQKHLKEKSCACPSHQITHTARQMAMSVQHLHSHLVVHRDIKGDNYLQDRPDMMDPKCKIILTDFGTACNIKVNERLRAAVGTKIFWSPEFCHRDYGPKVDVWAMGVIMYGLVTGRFPFKDQADILSKEIRLPKRCDPGCEQFIRCMLEKKEGQRADSDQVMAHPWLVEKDEKAHYHTEEDDLDQPKAEGLRAENVNDGIKERRQVLMRRMQQENEANKGAKKSPASGHHLANVFLLDDEMIPGAKYTYEWWSREKANTKHLLDLDTPGSPPDKKGETVDLRMFAQMLEEHNIDASVFGQGKAKTLAQLAAEVVSGACRLMLDATSHKKLVRVVDVVGFRLLSSDGKSRLLIETEECYPDGRRRDTVRLPGTKKEPHENARGTAQRILQDMLDIPLENVFMDFSDVVRYEEETDSPSFPGVRTVYRKEIVEAVVKGTNKAFLQKIGLPNFNSWSAAGKDGNTKTFQWMTEDEAKAKKVKFNAEGTEVISALVRAPIGMTEEQLQETLVAAGIDVSRYGQSGKSKTLKEFASELIRGEAMLMKTPTGHLQRVVDVVMLIVERPDTGEILVQTEHEKKDGHKTVLNRLPGSKCRPDENQFLSARRILRRQLDMNENEANISQLVTVVEEQKPTDFYPGLKTVYRKRLIRAHVVPLKS